MPDLMCAAYYVSGFSCIVVKLTANQHNSPYRLWYKLLMFKIVFSRQQGQISHFSGFKPDNAIEFGCLWTITPSYAIMWACICHTRKEIVVMNKLERYPSYAACVAHALSNSEQPLSVDVLLNKVASQRPVGKGARSAVYRAISKLFQAVPVAPGRYGWLTYLLNGTIYRHSLTSEEARRGFLLLDELEHIAFYPQFFQSYRPDGRVLTVDLFGGLTIQAEATIERKTWSLHLGPTFVEWIDELGGQNRDDILISVVDAAAGHYAFRLQLHEIRDESAIQNRNIQLALLAEELVAEDRRTRASMPTWELAARLVGRGFFRELPPADDLHYALHEYSMLRLRDDFGYQLGSDLEEEVAGEQFLYAPFSLDYGEPYVETRFGEDKSLIDNWEMVADSDLRDERGVVDDACPSYADYLGQVDAAQSGREPLSHEDFHLLEAELEMLVRLEQDFGHLLGEQQDRLAELAARLFIDPATLLDGDWDPDEDDDYEDPPFWQN